MEGMDDCTLRQLLSGILYSKEEGTSPRDTSSELQWNTTVLQKTQFYKINRNNTQKYEVE